MAKCTPHMVGLKSISGQLGNAQSVVIEQGNL